MVFEPCFSEIVTGAEVAGVDQLAPVNGTLVAVPLTLIWNSRAPTSSYRIVRCRVPVVGRCRVAAVARPADPDGEDKQEYADDRRRQQHAAAAGLRFRAGGRHADWCRTDRARDGLPRRAGHHLRHGSLNPAPPAVVQRRELLGWPGVIRPRAATPPRDVVSPLATGRHLTPSIPPTALTGTPARVKITQFSGERDRSRG